MQPECKNPQKTNSKQKVNQINKKALNGYHMSHSLKNTSKSRIHLLHTANEHKTFIAELLVHTSTAILFTFASRLKSRLHKFYFVLKNLKKTNTTTLRVQRAPLFNYVYLFFSNFLVDMTKFFGSL